MRCLRNGVMLLATLMLVTAPVLAGNIGFVDAERAVASVKEGQAKLREFEAWAEPERQRVTALQTKMNDLRQQINQQSAVSAEEALEELRERELSARREFDDARRDFQRQLEAKQNEFLGDVAVKVGTVASEYGKANGFDAIFVLNAQPLVYVAESADLTDTIIKLYDERFPYTGN
jgi:Skp family chaperone for outer membrane proteins